MSRQPPTEEQRRAIETTGVDLCVVAGAGTGKTFTLTQRIVGRVTVGRLPLRRILAITFTEKAAAEMKERLGDALEKAGHAGARQEVEAAAISTVHALCARILREHAVAASVDPGFAVLDEIEADRLRDDALDRLVDEIRERAPEDFALLASLGGADPAETIAQVHREAQQSGRAVAEFVGTVPGLPPVVAAMATFRAAAEAVAACAGRGPKATQDKVARVAAALAAVPAPDADAAVLEHAVAAVGAATNLAVAKEVKPAMEELRETSAETLEVLAEHALAPVRAALARAVDRLDALYDDAKGRGEKLDFADLERRAVRLLEDRPDVRDAVRARWTEVLVDEFQDTNPVQARLVESLRTPGALFVVGDPKQSIYGFRGADLSVFDDRLRDVEAQGHGGVVQLRHSHRSRPEILGFVNRLFVGGVGGGTGPSADVRMIARRSWAPASGPCIDAAAFPCDRMPDGRDAEARWIAGRIAAMCDGSFRVAAPSADDALRTRHAEFGDVAVLLRATTNVKILEQALVAAEIPYLVVKGRGFFAAREVVDFANLLRCVDDPRDDLALAAVLRSPACGVSDDGLFALTAARERLRASGAPGDGPAEGGREFEPLSDVLFGWHGADRAVPDLADDPADVAALRTFTSVLLDLRARRGTDGVAALVSRAFDRLRLDVLALGRPNGRQRAANLRKIRSLAREADADGLSLAEFTDVLRDLRAREVREAEAAVAGGAVGAVSLMTVHAAKGLEFPIVFVPDCGNEQRSRGDGVVSTLRLGVGLKERDGGTADVRPWAWQRIADAQAAAERAEMERLLYVAVTRASDHLVLTAALRMRGEMASSPRVWWDRLSAALGLDEGGRFAEGGGGRTATPAAGGAGLRVVARSGAASGRGGDLPESRPEATSDEGGGGAAGGVAGGDPGVGVGSGTQTIRSDAGVAATGRSGERRAESAPPASRDPAVDSGAPTPEPGEPTPDLWLDIDVGPGADEAAATRTLVRVHEPVAVAERTAAPARSLLGRHAAAIGAGRVPQELPCAEAVAAASALVAEASRRAPEPDGTPFAVNVSALTAFARCPQEYRLRYVVGVPDETGARPFGGRTAFDMDEAPHGTGGALDERPGDSDEGDIAPDVRALGRAVHAALERLVPGGGRGADADTGAGLGRGSGVDMEEASGADPDTGSGSAPAPRSGTPAPNADAPSRSPSPGDGRRLPEEHPSSPGRIPLALSGAATGSRAGPDAGSAAAVAAAADADADAVVRAEVETALRAEIGGAEPSPAQVDELVKWVRGFLSGEIGRAVAHAQRPDVRREQAFLLRSGRTVIRGQIDLLYHQSGPASGATKPGWVVVDYKLGATGRPRAEHELQMRLYALGVAGVTGSLPARLVLWSLPHARAVPVRFDDEDRAEVEGLLAEFAARSSRRDYAPRPSPPCSTCPVRRSCRFAPAAS